jgi:hypothetical protein
MSATMSSTKTLLLTALTLLSVLSVTPLYAPAASVLAAPLARADDYTGPVLYDSDGRIAMKFAGFPVAGATFDSRCTYTDPQAGGDSRRGEAFYKLRTDHGWTSDCDALRGRVVQHCPGARMAPPQCLHVLNKLELRFGITSAAERECAAGAITALSPAARAKGYSLPKCV